MTHATNLLSESMGCWDPTENLTVAFENGFTPSTSLEIGTWSLFDMISSPVPGGILWELVFGSSWNKAASSSGQMSIKLSKYKPVGLVAKGMGSFCSLGIQHMSWSEPWSSWKARFENRNGIKPGTTSTEIHDRRFSCCLSGIRTASRPVSDALFPNRNLTWLSFFLNLLVRVHGKACFRHSNVLAPMMHRPGGASVQDGMGAKRF